MTDSPVAQIVAALSYGERLASKRAAEAADLAPDARGRNHETSVAERERSHAEILEYRLGELGTVEMQEVFHPFFDTFFERTTPSDWLEAQIWHYVGDAMVSDLSELLTPALDPVSSELVRRALADRDEQEAFALHELTRGLEADPAAGPRIAAYARKVIGEALTQTRRAVTATGALRDLLGGQEGEKAVLLEVLERHRRRLDRLGIEPVDDPSSDDD